MRVLLQRVTQGSVSVEGSIVGQIGAGLVLLACAGHDDTPQVVQQMARKTAELRIFCDDAGKMNLSLLDIQGQALVISQFTLYADARKGRRPSFTGAGKPDLARPLVDLFAQELRNLGVSHVAAGQFGADMHVVIHNDGPVTIWLDSVELGMQP
jgi:D-tyrosyl-tRNA(Tyr) deacylase